MTQAVEKTEADPLQEIRDLIIRHLPALPDIPANEAFGDFAAAIQFIAQGQHKNKPALRHPRIAFFTASEAAAGNYGAPSHPLPRLAAEANADFKIYDLSQAPENATAADAARAAAYGMMAVTPGIDMLAICADSGNRENALDVAPAPVAAALGAMIAARLAKIPVIIEGSGAEQAESILSRLNPEATRHVRAAHDILPPHTRLPDGCHAALCLPFLKSLLSL